MAAILSNQYVVITSSAIIQFTHNLVGRCESHAYDSEKVKIETESRISV